MAIEDLAGRTQEWIESGAWLKAAGRVAVAAAIVGAAFLLARVFQSGMHRLRGAFKTGAPVAYVVEQLGTYAIVLIGVVSGAATLGLDLSSLALFGGAVGVGVGLGLQGIVKEFVSGIVLIFDPMVQVGDFVELQNDVRGEVVEIGPRAVRLRTNDDLNVVIPNSVFMQDRVTNWTYNSASRRIHVPFSVAEESDIAKVRDIALAAARALPFTLPEDGLHKTQVWLNGFAGGGLEFDLVVWPTLESSRHPRTLHAAYTWAIYEALRAAGIRNAQDQLDLRLRGVFGRDDDEALRALNLHRAEREAGRGGERPAVVDHAPNDAATAVYDDADRRIRRQGEAPRQRVRPT